MFMYVHGIEWLYLSTQSEKTRSKQHSTNQWSAFHKNMFSFRPWIEIKILMINIFVKIAIKNGFQFQK